MTEQHTVVQPTADHEAVLRIIADVLKVPQVAATDSFYDFGGTSLQAMRICARLGKELGLRVKPEVLFESDTLADVISAADRGRTRISRDAPFLPDVQESTPCPTPFPQLHGSSTKRCPTRHGCVPPPSRSSTGTSAWTTGPSMPPRRLRRGPVAAGVRPGTVVPVLLPGDPKRWPSCWPSSSAVRRTRPWTAAGQRSGSTRSPGLVGAPVMVTDAESPGDVPRWLCRDEPLGQAASRRAETAVGVVDSPLPPRSSSPRAVPAYPRPCSPRTTRPPGSSPGAASRTSGPAGWCYRPPRPPGTPPAWSCGAR